MNRKHQQSIYHANVNISLIAEDIIQIKSRIVVNIDVSLRNIKYLKKIILAILLYVVVKMVNI